ncbi:MAG: redoxin family protein [Luteolibacter sp.]|uniref:redoxin family protein n=1 Tax=Luteolibacter sp. TaxID=1962973 RepID=UPI003264FBB8
MNILPHRVAQFLASTTAFVCVCHAAEVESRPIAPLQLPDLAGKATLIPDPKSKATVLIFLSTTCPICNKYAPEITRLAKTYTAHGISFLLVQIEKDLSPEGARKHANDFNLPSPVILDPGHRLANITGCTSTPQVAVVSSDRIVVYRGCIDDRFFQLGKDSINPKHSFLRQALDEILAGKPVSEPTTPAIGCVIE